MHRKRNHAVAVAKTINLSWVVLTSMFLVLAVMASVNAQANTAVERHITNAQPVGEGRLTYFVWDVYDAKLYASDGQFDKDEPYALTLYYLRSLEGQKIADTSAEAIRKLGFSDEVKLAAWHAEMAKIFPNVDKGIELTGVYEPNKPTRFYRGSEEIGVVRDPEFGRWFFDIWLSDKTEKPQLRAKLLGQ